MIFMCSINNANNISIINLMDPKGLVWSAAAPTHHKHTNRWYHPAYKTIVIKYIENVFACVPNLTIKLLIFIFNILNECYNVGFEICNAF